MPADVEIEGDPVDVMAKLANLGKYLSGEIPDPSGAIKEALIAVGLVTLANIHDHFERLSTGGMGDDGTVWPALSVVTLALKHKDKSIASISKFVDSLTKNPNVSRARRRMFLNNAKRMRAFYERGANKAARRRAMKILDLMKPYISETRYNKTRKELESIGGKKPLKRKTLNRLVFASASALILYDSGDLFNSLEPFIGALYQVFKIGPGWVEVGTAKDYAKYHQSPEPRKMKADGTPILPRRAFLPDKIPDKWYADAMDTLRSILGSSAWMIKFLRG